jgi:alpha-ribazole phosphatase
VRLLLVRHGATLNNAQQRYTGQSDIPLSELGERQVAALADRLATESFDCIVTSDLRRAFATAEVIAAGHDVPLRREPALREISMGEWEGRTREEVIAVAPREHERWHADPVHHAPPRGETIAQVRDRLAKALERSYDAYPESTVLWVTHGGVIGILLCHLLGMDLNRRWQFRRDNASITELEIAPDYAIIHRTNDTLHLRGIMSPDLAEATQIL